VALERAALIPMNLPSKTFQKNGKWIEKPLKSVPLECRCGNKYIKTRRMQKECITCIYKAAHGRA
jgi:hypothetical protein